MKKVMLILMLGVCGVVHGSWFGSDVDPEIKVGQVWEYKANGDKREVLEVGDKYVIYGYTNGGDKSFPSVKTREGFLEYYKLVEDVLPVAGVVEVVWGTAVSNEDLIFIVGNDPEAKKPYLHRNPNNDHWICSKHGDLEPNDLLIYYATTITYYGGDIYCYKCFGETLNKVLNQHITGVKEKD